MIGKWELSIQHDQYGFLERRWWRLSGVLVSYAWRGGVENVRHTRVLYLFRRFAITWRVQR